MRWPAVGAVDLEVSAGAGHTCAITTLGTLTCFGRNDEGQADPPDGILVTVREGAQTSCALDSAGRETCWRRYVRQQP